MSSWSTSSPVAAAEQQDLDQLVDGAVDQYRSESPLALGLSSPSEGIGGVNGSVGEDGWIAGGGVPPAEESAPLLCGNGSAAAAEDNHNAASGRHPNLDQEWRDDSPGNKADWSQLSHILSDDYDFAVGTEGCQHVADDEAVASMETEMANLNVGCKCVRDDEDEDDESESTDAGGDTERRESEGGKGLPRSPNSSTSVRDLVSNREWKPVPSPNSMTSSADISQFTGFHGDGTSFDNADAVDRMPDLGAEKSPPTLATPGNVDIAALPTEEWNGSPPSISASSLPTPLPSVDGSPYSQLSLDFLANDRSGVDDDGSDDCRNANDSIGSGGDGGRAEKPASAENLSPSDDRSIGTEEMNYMVTGVSNNPHHTDMERDVNAAITPAAAGGAAVDGDTPDIGGGVSADGGADGSINGGGDDTASIIRNRLIADKFVPLDLILDTSTAKPRLKLIIQCTEIFVITESTADKYIENNAVAEPGQVGIRCALCKDQKEKGGHNFSLLTKPEQLYNQIKNLSIHHLEKACSCIGEETQNRLSIKDKGRNRALGPQGMEKVINDLKIFDTKDLLGDQKTFRLTFTPGGDDDNAGDGTGEDNGLGEPEEERRHRRGKDLGQTETELDSGDFEEIQDDEIRTGRKSADALRRKAEHDAEKQRRRQIARDRIAAYRANEPPPLPLCEAKLAVDRRSRKIALQKTRRLETKSDDDE